METYRLKNIDCADCASKIEDGLRGSPGIRSVSVDFATLSLRIDADDMRDVERRIRSIEPGVRVMADLGRSDTEENGTKPFALGRDLLILSAGILLFAVGAAVEGRLLNNGIGWPTYALFAAAYLLAGWNVLLSAFRGVLRGKVFNEHFLMTVATGGAFAIHAVAEAVGVMIFYKAGEILQNLAVERSRRSIRALLELRPDFARLRKNGGFIEVGPEDVAVGDEVSVKPGERVPLDGTVISGAGLVDTSAMTGEATPRRVEPGEEVLAGYISKDGSLFVRVTRSAGESSAAKIIKLVEEATHAKAKTELFITRFAAIYTPVVVAGAALVAFVPPLVFGADLSSWVYRALTMLVISCPCALVVSIPLGYFGGVGGASRRGVLIKGARFLDTLAAVKTVVFDKTGTLTKGVFRVTSVEPRNGKSAEELLKYAAMAESHSNHPIAASIREAYHGPLPLSSMENGREIGGFGVTAVVEGHAVVVGNDRLMHREMVEHGMCDIGGTAVHVAVDGAYAGYIAIGDELKHDSGKALGELRTLGVEHTALLTGDSLDVAEKTARGLGIDEYYGELLPADKVAHLERIMHERSGRGKTAFVGDGINDAPVLARSDVGIAMGQSGSDAAVETADVVLMTDSLEKVAEAIRGARKTRRIIIQNIAFALGVKAVFLALGGAGVASMWEAVIADMGVTLAAVVNSTRAMWRKGEKP
jgi:Cd2+/Zn2+-exporting ATPase